MESDILFGFRLLECAQNLVSNGGRIGQAFNSRRELLKFVVSEITVSRAGRKNEVIVRYGDMLAICVVYKNAALLLIHAGDLAHDHGRVLLFSQNSADWGADLGWGKHRRRYLIEERLKQMMICPINQNDLDRRFAKSFCRSQAAKPTADDHYAGCMTGAGVIVCHIWFWLPLFLKLSGAEISQILKIRSPAEAKRWHSERRGRNEGNC